MAARGNEARALIRAVAVGLAHTTSWLPTKIGKPSRIFEVKRASPLI